MFSVDFNHAKACASMRSLVEIHNSWSISNYQNLYYSSCCQFKMSVYYWSSAPYFSRWQAFFSCFCFCRRIFSTKNVFTFFAVSIFVHAQFTYEWTHQKQFSQKNKSLLGPILRKACLIIIKLYFWYIF